VVDAAIAGVVRAYLRNLRDAGIPVAAGIVFGSHARGDTGRGSDVDLLVVMPVEGSRREKAIEIGVAYTGMDKKTVGTALEHINYNGRLERRQVSEYIDFMKDLRYIKKDISDKLLSNLLAQ